MLTFLDSLGAPYDLTGITFEFRAAFIASLVVSTNTITISILETEPVSRESYFWEIVNTVTKKTWLCGTAYFTSDNSSEVEDTGPITIELNGELVQITIIESGGSGDVDGGTP